MSQCISYQTKLMSIVTRTDISIGILFLELSTLYDNSFIVRMLCSTNNLLMVCMYVYTSTTRCQILYLQPWTEAIDGVTLYRGPISHRFVCR